MKKVPAFDLTRQYGMLEPEMSAALRAFLLEGKFILGEAVEVFEAELAARTGADYAIGVANGTDAIELSLRALGIGPGDLVLTTPFTFFATASAVCMTGATPVFADIDPDDFCLSPAAVAEFFEGRSASAKRIGLDHRRCKAILPVHLYGQAARLAELKRIADRHGVPLIEDTAQAIGASEEGRQTGTWGATGTLSFFPTKNLGCYGDGGAVLTSDEHLVQRLRKLRVQGASAKYVHTLTGRNSRLDALQAVILHIKLRHLDSWTAARRRIAQHYGDRLKEAAGAGIFAPRERAGTFHVFHQYTLRVSGGVRTALQDHLRLRGIETSVYYPIPLHLQEALLALGYRKGDFAQSERASAEVLSLPMFPELLQDECDRTVNAVLEFCKMPSGGGARA